VRVVVYTINKIDLDRTTPAINNATDKVNNWLRNELGAENVLETESATGGQLAGDNTHPTKQGYAALWNGLEEKTRQLSFIPN